MIFNVVGSVFFGQARHGSIALICGNHWIKLGPCMVRLRRDSHRNVDDIMIKYREV